MAVLPILLVLLVTEIARCKCESVSGYNYNYGNSASQFGNLLRPPPPPLPFAPVPFYGGKAQRQNIDVGFHYQASPSPQTTTVPPTSDFKFPAPFYKQYNFNFVPPPQPFTTTPSPSMFQKISGWLFPSQQVESDSNNFKVESLKKDCNPCNLVPWIPVIKYSLGEKNTQQNPNPTYGPPSPTALAQNVFQYHPKPFNSPNKVEKPKQLFEEPYVNYESQTQVSSNAFGNPSLTYGPPSATQTVPISSQNPHSSSYSIHSSTYGFTSSHGLPMSSYSIPSLTLSPSSYVTPVATFDVGRQVTTTPFPNSETYIPEVLQNYSPVENNDEVLNVAKPSGNLQLPKVSHPIGFKNSYGEDITNTHSFDIPDSITAIGAESSKIKTQVSPYMVVHSSESNISVALANPAPFSLNRGRNIHTLQPVALPNLSVSPLPPIFNARPFRPITSTNIPNNLIHRINYMQKPSNNINVAQSVPIAEFVHSVEYPTTIIQSPVIDIDATKTLNHNKVYRNIPNSYNIDEVRDISPQASEAHISAAKANQDVSFETTGAEFGSILYDNNLPTDMKYNFLVPPNHKPEFVDLRGAKDEDVDRYRTESNLQSIDSPLLYLKPSAPHKNYKNFVSDTHRQNTHSNQKEYEMYDDVSTTAAVPLSNLSNDSDENKTYYKKSSLSSAGQDDKRKIIQIIVPYITQEKQKHNNKELHSVSQEGNHLVDKEEYGGRKVSSNTESGVFDLFMETSTVLITTTEHSSTVTEHYDSEIMSTPTVLNDFYDVKEPPFDIIKLQHTIDDWTQQEYSNRYATPDRTRSNEKYAKQIPDEFLTTMNPNAHGDTATNDYNYDDFEHEGSSSMQHSVTEIKNSTLSKLHKGYNSIDRIKTEHLDGKSEDHDENLKLRIYTAASSFRSTTTTPAPWGSIQTSISPLTKEKVYVVTSKPWRDKSISTTEFDYVIDKFESKKSSVDSNKMAVVDFPFKSPRFASRPPFGFTASGPVSLDSIKSDSSYGFSKGWHQSINNLRSLYQRDSTFSSEGPDERSSK